MIARRDLVAGLGCVAALGLAEYLRPRRSVRLLGTAKLDEIVPLTFGQWGSVGGANVLIPKTPGSLAEKLYSQTVPRLYRDAAGHEVMLLIAYGDAQSDLLQLHRPETCYPAVGFAITRRALTQTPLWHGVQIPTVALTAQSGDRTEDLLYWTRLGEGLPQTAGAQRSERLAAAIAGYVGDGVLVRTSMVRREGVDSFSVLTRFIAAMIGAMRPETRAALVASARGTLLA